MFAPSTEDSSRAYRENTATPPPTHTHTRTHTHTHTHTQTHPPLLSSHSSPSPSGRRVHIFVRVYTAAKAPQCNSTVTKASRTHCCESAGWCGWACTARHGKASHGKACTCRLVRRGSVWLHVRPAVGAPVIFNNNDNLIGPAVGVPVIFNNNDNLIGPACGSACGYFQSGPTGTPAPRDSKVATHNSHVWGFPVRM